MDIGTVLLNSVLDDVIYVRLPPGFKHLVPRGNSFLLLKSFYGFEQASRMWKKTLDDFLEDKCVIQSSKADRCLYTLYSDGNLELVIMIYVIYILLMSKKNYTLQKTKAELAMIFKMTDLGILKWFLGINISQIPEIIYLKKTAYVDKFL